MLLLPLLLLLDVPDTLFIFLLFPFPAADLPFNDREEEDCIDDDDSDGTVSGKPYDDVGTLDADDPEGWK